MKKKLLSLLLVAAMGLSMLVGCGGGSTGNTQGSQGGSQGGEEQKYDFTGVEIKLWVAENIVDFTKQQIEDIFYNNAIRLLGLEA